MCLFTQRFSLVMVTLMETVRAATKRSPEWTSLNATPIRQILNSSDFSSPIAFMSS